ncbi:MAG: hypothetical protein ACYDCJ_01670 [Gammaproteobacteria bacterium]
MPSDPLNVGQAYLGDAQGLEPPDPILAVGTHYIVQLDNGAATFFARIVHGTPQQQAAPPMALGGAGGLFVTTKSRFSDPWIVFDPITQRWFASLVQFNLDSKGKPTSSDVLLAFTSAEDPTNASSWTTLIVSSSSSLQDQPKLSVGFDKVLMTWENVSQNNAQIEILDKQDIVDGSPLVGVAGFNDGVGILDCLKGMVPARMGASSSQTMYALSTKTSCGDSVIRVYTVTGTPDAGNVNVQSNSVNLKSSFTVPQDPTDDITNQQVDAGDARLLSAVWHNDELFATGADGCIPPTDSVPRSCVRIYEVSVAGNQPTLIDDFDITGDLTPDYVFHPALDVDQNGNIIGAMEESPSGFLNVLAFAIPAGSEQPVLSIGDFFGNLGVGFYPLGCFDTNFNAERTGDYSGAATDPLYPDVVWLTGEMSGGTGSAGATGACSSNTVLGSFTLGTREPVVSSLKFSANGYGAVMNVTGTGFASWPSGAAAGGWCISLGTSPAVEVQDSTQGWYAGQPGDSASADYSVWQTAQTPNTIAVCPSAPAMFAPGDQVSVTLASDDGLLASVNGTVPNLAAITLLPPLPSSVVVNQSFTLTGEVQDSRGYYAGNTPVTLNSSPPQPSLSTSTDATGTFSFPVTAPWINGPLTLTFSAVGVTKSLAIPVVAYTAVDGVSPNHGLVCSQTPVTIIGSNFNQGLTGIDFGATSATAVLITGPDSLTATSPRSPLPGTISCPQGGIRRAAGAVPVVATLLNTSSSGGPDFYYYLANAPLFMSPGDISECLKAKVQAQVWNANGQPLANTPAAVTFSATPATTTTFAGTSAPGQQVTVGTDSAGIASTWLTSAQDGSVQITATTAAGSDTITTSFVQPNYCPGGGYAVAMPSNGLVWLPTGPGPLTFGSVAGEPGWTSNPGPEVPDFYQGTSFVEQGHFGANLLHQAVRGYIASKPETLALFRRFPVIAIQPGVSNGRIQASFVAPVVVLSGAQALQRQRLAANSRAQSLRFRVSLPMERGKSASEGKTMIVWLNTNASPAHWTTAGLSAPKVEHGLVSATTGHIGIFSAVRLVQTAKNATQPRGSRGFSSSCPGVENHHRSTHCVHLHKPPRLCSNPNKSICSGTACRSADLDTGG